MRPRLAGIGLALLGVLGGCDALRPAASADHPTWKKRPGGVLDVVYTRDLVANSRAVGEPYERTEPTIDVTGRRVFVGSSDGGLYALSAPLGEVLWRFETLSFVQSAPLYDEETDAVYFGSHDGALYKVDARSGKLGFRLSTRAEVSRRPVLADGVVYFANANDTLLSVDAASGKILWSHHRTPALGMEIAGYSGPVLGHGLVYMGFSDGTATAFDQKTGEERWEPVDLAAEAEEALGEIPKYLDVDTTPVLVETEDGPLAIFGSYQGGVYALDALLGTLIWSNTEVAGVSELELFEEPAHERDGVERPARRLLIASTGTTGLWGLDPGTGEAIWQRDLPRGSASHAAVGEGILVVNNSQLGTFLVSPVDGSLIDGLHFDLGVSGNPAAHGSRAFVMTNGGTLIALRITAPRLASGAPDFGKSGGSPFPR